MFLNDRTPQTSKKSPKTRLTSTTTEMSPVRKGATPQTQSANVSPPVVKRTTNHQNSLVSAKNMPTVFKKGKIIYFYEKTEGKNHESDSLTNTCLDFTKSDFFGGGGLYFGKIKVNIYV